MSQFALHSLSFQNQRSDFDQVFIAFHTLVMPVKNKNHFSKNNEKRRTHRRFNVFFKKSRSTKLGKSNKSILQKKNWLSENGKYSQKVREIDSY